MKKIAFIFLFCAAQFVITGTLSAQQPLTFNMDFDSISVPKYEFTGLGTNQTYFQMSYAGYQIFNSGVATTLEGKNIRQIDLVYTDHPKNADLEVLNQKRLAALFLVMPELFSNQSVKWQLVKQTDCSSPGVYSMFHGFAISYGEGPVSAASNEETPELQGEAGNLRVNLRWNSIDDLDLFVIDPCGNKIFYEDTVQFCHDSKGKLDVDANVHEEKLTNTPQENIFWVTPHQGAYEVIVDFYEKKSDLEQVEFHVTIVDKGVKHEYSGTLKPDEEKTVVTYQLE